MIKNTHQPAYRCHRKYLLVAHLPSLLMDKGRYPLAYRAINDTNGFSSYVSNCQARFNQLKIVRANTVSTVKTVKPNF